MVSSLITLITKSPYGREDSFAGLRYALSQIAGGVMEKSDTVLMEDGVYNAVKGQKSEAIGMPSNLDATQDLLDLDGTVFCVKEDVAEREIPEGNLMDGLEMIARSALSSLVAEYDAVTTY